MVFAPSSATLVDTRSSRAGAHYLARQPHWSTRGGPSGEEHLFDGLLVTNQIRRALDKKVWSHPAATSSREDRAMGVIDVNTAVVGKSNLEIRSSAQPGGAEEIARKLRLRYIWGSRDRLVDMLVPPTATSSQALQARARPRQDQVAGMDISRLGLVQMNRKKREPGAPECSPSLRLLRRRGAQMWSRCWVFPSHRRAGRRPVRHPVEDVPRPVLARRGRGEDHVGTIPCAPPPVRRPSGFDRSVGTLPPAGVQQQRTAA